MDIWVDVMTSLETRMFQDSECDVSEWRQEEEMNRAAEPRGRS